MDSALALQIRNALLDRRLRLVGRSNGKNVEARESNDAGSAGAEIIDIAQNLEQQERETSLQEQERRELSSVERALAKIATGTFGVCEDCEEEIPSRRLLVLPEARLCARCQAIEERERSRHSRGIRNAVA